MAASASGARTAWLAALAGGAPDFVEAYERLEEGGTTLSMRRLIRTRAGEASAAGILAQHEAVAAAYASHLELLPEAAFRASGGEEQWNVAQALRHAPLDHPLVGHLRCGEWLLFAGIHDLMHLDQLASLAAELGVDDDAEDP